MHLLICSNQLFSHPKLVHHVALDFLGIDRSCNLDLQNNNVSGTETCN